MTTSEFLAAIQGKYVEIVKGEMLGFLNVGDQVRFTFEPNGTVLTVKINYGALNTVSGILVQCDAKECIILFNIPNHSGDGFVSCFFCFEVNKKGELGKIDWGAIDAHQGYSTRAEILYAIAQPKSRVHKVGSSDDRGTGTGRLN